MTKSLVTKRQDCFEDRSDPSRSLVFNYRINCKCCSKTDTEVTYFFPRTLYPKERQMGEEHGWVSSVY